MRVDEFGFDPVLARAWDRWWLSVWRSSYYEAFFRESSDFDQIADFVEYSSLDVFSKPCFTDNGAEGHPVDLFIDPKEIIGKRVVEIGAGCGFIATRLSAYFADYLGFEYSKFAAAIANTLLPETFIVHWLCSNKKIDHHKSTFDTVFVRALGIHSNTRENAAILKLGHYLLKPGGKIYCSFFRSGDALENAVIYPPDHPMDPAAITAGYDLSRFDALELCRRTGLRLESFQDDKIKYRSRVIFNKY